jgi:hypothetical protein
MSGLITLLLGGGLGYGIAYWWGFKNRGYIYNIGLCCIIPIFTLFIGLGWGTVAYKQPQETIILSKVLNTDAPASQEDAFSVIGVKPNSLSWEKQMQLKTASQSMIFGLIGAIMGLRRKIKSVTTKV